jgi:hypothetical protein
VELLDQAPQVPTENIAIATLRAARSKINAQRNNPTFSHCVWLLVHLPQAARGDKLPGFLEGLDVSSEAGQSPGSFLAALSHHLLRFSFQQPHDSALSEIVPLAFKEAVSRMLSQPTVHLFGMSGEEVRSALRRYSEGPAFADCAATFFGSFLKRTLLYFLSKEVGNHVGPTSGFEDTAAYGEFEDAIRRYCQERAKIVSEFAADWHGKYVWKGEASENRVKGFVAVCLRKLFEELQVEERAP